jgi:hypothetical protein
LIRVILPRREVPALIMPETAAKFLESGETLLPVKMENHLMMITVKSPAAGRE